MIGQENTIIKEKINYFYNQQKRVHLTKLPTIKFPKGKFHNGTIGQVYDDLILFDDDEEGVIEIIKFDIADIEFWKERGKNDRQK